MNEEITYGDNGEIKIILPTTEEQEPSPATDSQEESLWQKIKKHTTEDDTTTPHHRLTLRDIIGGEILITDIVRKQVWLVLLITLFIVAYIAEGYVYRKFLLDIDHLTTELRDAKYRTLSIESDLTEKTRESKIIERLHANHDSLLHRSTQAPFVVPVPQEQRHK